MTLGAADAEMNLFNKSISKRLIAVHAAASWVQMSYPIEKTHCVSDRCLKLSNYRSPSQERIQ